MEVELMAQEVEFPSREEPDHASRAPSRNRSEQSEMPLPAPRKRSHRRRSGGITRTTRDQATEVMPPGSAGRLRARSHGFRRYSMKVCRRGWSPHARSNANSSGEHLPARPTARGFCGSCPPRQCHAASAALPCKPAYDPSRPALAAVVVRQCFGLLSFARGPVSGSSPRRRVELARPEDPRGRIPRRGNHGHRVAPAIARRRNVAREPSCEVDQGRDVDPRGGSRTQPSSLRQAAGRR
mmetsp:Transcript_32419/g.89617  ORF Transcript_32419/g.89617 Transcript_32419/m.89617 type:complete len:239 (+) Transcript_32419:546-1262(+)